MKIATFDELFEMPAGTVFGQSNRQEPEFGTGLYVKRESCVEEGDGIPRSIDFQDVLLDRWSHAGEGPAGQWVFADEVNEGRVFLVYEVGDIGRLVGWITGGRRP